MMAEGEMRDIVIVGAGVGGYEPALRAATWGARVTLVERAELGGTCLNRGCIPAKTFVEAAAEFEHAKSMGCAVDSDLARVVSRKNGVVKVLRAGVAGLLKKRGVEVMAGTGRIAEPGAVEVETADGARTVLRAKNIIMATGSRPAQIRGLEPDGRVVFDSDAVLDATSIGLRLAIIGGGILGAEFAFIYSSFGHQVTIVEALPRILPIFSEEAANEVVRSLKKSGAKILTGKLIESSDRSGEVVRLSLAGGETLEADAVLVAVGRRPNTADIGLAELDLLDDRGFAKADAHGRTSVPGIWCVGDMNGQAMLAHYAIHQGLSAVAGCLGRPMPRTGATPWGAYGHPEVASVGLNEAEAREKGEILVGKFPMMALGRARAAGDTTGYFKIVASADTHRVLGVEIVGLHATDLIQEAALAVRLEARLEDIEETTHAHPTFAEGLMEAALVALGRPIHI